MMSRVFFCLVISVMLSSCDIAHYLIVHNQTEDDIDLIWSKNIAPPFRLDSPQPLYLKPGGSWQEYYGFGKWSREDELSLMEILKDSKLAIGGEDVSMDHRAILKRKGMFNNELNVTIR